MMEVMRLRPPIDVSASFPFPLLLTIAQMNPKPTDAYIAYREAAQDDMHEGRFVKKGTLLLVNMWYAPGHAGP